jgi:O-antigen/teichoic acid export membrane protein
MTQPDKGLDRLSERSRVLLSSGSLIFSNLAVAVLAIFTIHLQAQHLGAHGFGQLITVTSFVLTFALLVDLGVTTVTAREIAAQMDQADRILSTAIAFRVGLCLLVTPVLIGSALLIYPTERGTVGVGVAILSLDLVFVSVQAIVQAYYSAKVRNDVPSLLLVVAKVLYFAGTLVGVEAGGSVLVFLIAYVASDGVVASISFFMVRRQVSFGWDFSIRKWSTLAKTAVPVGAMQVVNRIYSRIDSVLLSILRTPADVAHYGIAFNFTDVLSNLPAYMMVSLMPSLVRAKGPEELKSRMQTALDVVVWFAAPIATGGYVLRHQIVLLVAGPGYGASVDPMALLILSMVVSFPQVVFVWGCLAIKAYKPLVPAVIVVTISNVSLNLWLIPPEGPSGAAFAQVCTETLSLVLVYWIFTKRSRVRLAAGNSVLAVMSAALLLPAGVPLVAALSGMTLLVEILLVVAILGSLYAVVSLLAGVFPLTVIEMIPEPRTKQILTAVHGVARKPFNRMSPPRGARYSSRQSDPAPSSSADESAHEEEEKIDP